MTERFIVDDCGTLIDMSTRDTYDYVSDVVGLLNDFNNKNKQLQNRINELELLNDLVNENDKLKQYTKQVLQNHLDGWRGVYNPIDESLVVEINVVKSIAEDLGVDLE